MYVVHKFVSDVSNFDLTLKTHIDLLLGCNTSILYSDPIMRSCFVLIFLSKISLGEHNDMKSPYILIVRNIMDIKGSLMPVICMAQRTT